MSADTLTLDGSPVVLPPFGGSDTPITYSAIAGAQEVAVAYQSGPGIEVVGYDLAGNQLFADTGPGSGGFTGIQSFNLAPAGGGGLAMAWTTQALVGPNWSFTGGYQFFDAAGQTLSNGTLDNAYGLTAFAGDGGAWLEWNATGPADATGNPGSYTLSGKFVGSNGSPSLVGTYATGSTPQHILPYAAAALPDGSVWSAFDNTVYLQNGSISVQIPNEPAHAITDLAMAAIGPSTLAVGWVDSGTDYVSLFDTANDIFRPATSLDSGGASDLHVVALPDGGFAVSWMNGGAYKGEVFDASGIGGGVIPLAGDVTGIDSMGDLYTVGLSGGQYAVQAYAVNGSSGSGSSVSTSASNYTAPDGVTTITLTGSHQTIHANSAGDTIFSNDTGNYLYGGTGNDTFHMGRGGDWAAGGGGSDTYDFAAIPWAAGGIIGFDGVLDLGGLLSTTQDVPLGGFSDGYLQLTDDGSGNTDVWARYATSGANSNWWLVTVIEGITTSNLDAHHTVVTLAPNAHAVTTSASDYVAPNYVTSIALTGSQQTIDASATNGVTIWSNDTGNALIGGPGNDTFHIGRGGDWVAGGGGADTFAYAATPWTAGGITDFNAAEGDRIDVSGLLQASGYAGSDPFADGYLKYGTDSSGNAQLWSDVNQPGNTGWWLVATLEGVSTSSLHYANGLIT